MAIINQPKDQHSQEVPPQPGRQPSIAEQVANYAALFYLALLTIAIAASLLAIALALVF